MPVALVLALLSIAADPTPSERIAHGQAELDALDYDAAALDFSLAAEDPRATDAERIAAHLKAGIADRIRNHDTEARMHFVYVLKRAPDTKLPDDTSLKIVSFYDLVKSEVVDVAPAKPADAKPPPPDPVPASPQPTPGAPPTATAPVRTVHAPAGSALTPVAVAAGGVVAVAGGVALVVGSVPYFQHEQATQDLAVAASAGSDGSDAQARQLKARSDWTQWGSSVATLGAVALVLGVAAGAIGFTLGSIDG